MTRRQIIAYILVLILVAAAVSYLFYLQKTNQPTENNSNSLGVNNNLIPGVADPETYSCKLSDGSIIYDPLRCEKVKTYRSEKLGVEFEIHESAKITEQGNKIFINRTEDGAGQSLEIISKPTSQTIKDKVIELSGPTYKECDIVDGVREYVEKYYPKTYSQVTVGVRESDWDRAGSEKPMLCQSKYAAANAMRTFVGDSENPDKIVFFDIGQYSVPAGEVLDWYQTFRFIK